ncbi:hypothetical protein KLEA5_gp15 [Aeromonas phage vB_AveS_KLEA5]|nr:hypothetical protein KLEA5_gp15 [Aeromonas phage vB_AveS_KLEA5]
MAKGLFSVTSTGLKEFIKEMEALADAIPEISLKALAEQEKVVQERIKTNWMSMVGGTPGGYVFSSVGQSVAMSKSDPYTVVGTVGVYKTDSVSVQFGKTEKDLNAAQIAYWVEFGTSRLRNGGRKKKGANYDDEQLINVAGVPFISNAFYSSLNEQQDAFKVEFNRLADQYRYTG